MYNAYSYFIESRSNEHSSTLVCRFTCRLHCTVVTSFPHTKHDSLRPASFRVSHHPPVCSCLRTVSYTFSILHRVVNLYFSLPFKFDFGIFDHPRSGVVYNFGRVYMSVCQTITFESFDVGSSYLHIRYISTDYGSSSYMNLIESRSWSQKVENSYSRNVKLRWAITPVLSNIEQ